MCATKTIITVDLNRVKRGDNDRQQFDEQGILELAISIARNGLQQPVTLRPTEDGMYEIVAGERRTRAHWWLQEKGVTYQDEQGGEVILAPGQVSTIEAIVRDLDDKTASDIMLVENTGRVDLNPMEEAYGYQKRMEKYKQSLEELAEVASVSLERVKRRLALLKLVDDIQHLVRHGSLPLGHAEALVDLDENRQRIALRIFNQAPNGLTLKKFKHIINDLLAEQKSQTLFDLEAFWVEQVQQDTMPRRGKKAFIPAPTSTNLPPVKRNVNWGAGDIMDQYIADLLAEGHTEAAEALGNIYHVLVKHNYTQTPVRSAIPNEGETYEAHEATGDDHRL